MSPFQALYGTKPHLTASPLPAATVAAVGDMLRQRGETDLALKEVLLKAQPRMKQFADKHRSEREF